MQVRAELAQFRTGPTTVWFFEGTGGRFAQAFTMVSAGGGYGDGTEGVFVSRDAAVGRCQGCTSYIAGGAIEGLVFGYFLPGIVVLAFSPSLVVFFFWKCWAYHDMMM